MPRRSTTIVERLHEQGIARHGRPGRFRYRHADGSRVSAADRARIEALKIPPAWRDVRISTAAGAAVQAVGMDAAGRSQYLYHQAHVARRERDKQRRMLGFIAALPRARRRVARDLARNGLRRERVLAGMVRVLATCFLRPGSAVYAKENGSYGITTLQRRHVAVRGAVVCFDFIGKSGKRQQRELRDRRLAALVRELLRHPGDVFKFRGEDGKLMDVRERHINAYIKQVMGRRFSAKDFRTWAANLLCAFALARASNGSKPGPTERKRQLTVAMREVAGLLGNTPAVCRASYVFSRVIRSHEQGKLRRFPRVDVAAANPRRSTIERSERVLAALLA